MFFIHGTLAWAGEKQGMWLSVWDSFTYLSLELKLSKTGPWDSDWHAPNRNLQAQQLGWLILN